MSVDSICTPTTSTLGGTRFEGNVEQAASSAAQAATTDRAHGYDLGNGTWIAPVSAEPVRSIAGVTSVMPCSVT